MISKEERTEQLYAILFDSLDELSEIDSADDIFDKIVDYFALRVEQAREDVATFTDMLRTFRKDNPIDSIPNEVPPADPIDRTVSRPERPDWDVIFNDLSDINKAFLSSNENSVTDFLKNIQFPDK